MAMSGGGAPGDVNDRPRELQRVAATRQYGNGCATKYAYARNHAAQTAMLRRATSVECYDEIRRRCSVRWERAVWRRDKRARRVI